MIYVRECCFCQNTTGKSNGFWSETRPAAVVAVVLDQNAREGVRGRRDKSFPPKPRTSARTRPLRVRPQCSTVRWRVCVVIIHPTPETIAAPNVLIKRIVRFTYTSMYMTRIIYFVCLIIMAIGRCSCAP